MRCLGSLIRLCALVFLIYLSFAGARDIATNATPHSAKDKAAWTADCKTRTGLECRP